MLKLAENTDTVSNAILPGAFSSRGAFAAFRTSPPEGATMASGGAWEVAAPPGVQQMYKMYCAHYM